MKFSKDRIDVELKMESGTYNLEIPMGENNFSKQFALDLFGVFAEIYFIIQKGDLIFFKRPSIDFCFFEFYKSTKWRIDVRQSIHCRHRIKIKGKESYTYLGIYNCREIKLYFNIYKLYKISYKKGSQGITPTA